MTVSVRAACEYRHRPLKKDIKRKGGEREQGMERRRREQRERRRDERRTGRGERQEEEDRRRQ